jgi:hypothetical protein
VKGANMGYDSSRHNPTIQDYIGYVAKVPLASHASAYERKSLIALVGIYDKRVNYQVLAKDKEVQTFDDLSDAIDYYNLC